MVFDIPFYILIAYMSFAIILGLAGLLMGIRRIDGAPFIMIFSGIMIFSLVVLVDDVEGTGLTGNQTQTLIPITIDYMKQETSTTSTTVRNGATTFVGEEVGTGSSFLYNKEINSVEMRFGKVGIPTGNIYFGVWNGVINPTATNYKFLIGQTLANQTNTSAMTYSYIRNDTKTYLLQSNDVVGMFYNGGSSGNHIFVSSNNTASSFDGSHSYTSRFTSGWLDTTTEDMRGRISLVKTQLQLIDKSHPFNDTDTWAFTIVISAFWILLGVVFQLRR